MTATIERTEGVEDLGASLHSAQPDITRMRTEVRGTRLYNRCVKCRIAIWREPHQFAWAHIDERNPS